MKTLVSKSTRLVSGDVEDTNPRCECVVERHGAKRICNKLLVRGTIRRPWVAICPRCKQLNKRAH